MLLNIKVIYKEYGESAQQSGTEILWHSCDY